MTMLGSLSSMGLGLPERVGANYFTRRFGEPQGEGTGAPPPNPSMALGP